MKSFVGLDLHSNNTVIGVVAESGKRILSKRMPNDMEEILTVLSQIQEVSGIALESTYNWYWLADGLMERGYPVHIVTPAAVVPYRGLKYSNDQSDSFWLAELLRLGILPKGHIIPREKRLLRDLLRKRCRLVSQRSGFLVGVKNLFLRALCLPFSSSEIKKMENDTIDRLVTEPSLNLSIKSSLTMIKSMDIQIQLLEEEIFNQTKEELYFKHLLSVKGIGRILAMVITLECGNIDRFRDAKHFASYCCCVPSQRISNFKKKGENNRRNGNKYLAWAFIEAARLSRKYCPYAQMFFRKKLNTSGNKNLALKALAGKLAKACFYIMRDGVPYDGKKLMSN